MRRARGFATALLGVMAALTVGSFALPAGYPASLLQAAAKAGFIGGIADWFAVVALFRHPLGLPIPHTAIIPAQKQRLGAALGRFLASHVFTQAELSRILGRVDTAAVLARLLADPQITRPLARGIAANLPRLLAGVGNGRAQRLFGRLMPRLVGGAGAGRLFARALRSLVDGGRHQEMVGFLLVRLRDVMAAKEDQLRLMIEERVREQGGRLVGWAIGAQVASRVLHALNDELDKVGTDSSELRQAIDEWARREIDLIETDPARAAEIGRTIRDVVGHGTVQAWATDVWLRLRGALEADAAQPGGHTALLIEGALGNLGAMIAADPETQARLRGAVERLVQFVLPLAQGELAGFIGSVVAGWDEHTIVERLELRVGRDLQFVRVNGTLVGFVLGGVVFMLLSALFGFASV